jgi:hypothetical protein
MFTKFWVISAAKVRGECDVALRGIHLNWNLAVFHEAAGGCPVVSKQQYRTLFCSEVPSPTFYPNSMFGNVQSCATGMHDFSGFALRGARLSIAYIFWRARWRRAILKKLEGFPAAGHEWPASRRRERRATGHSLRKLFTGFASAARIL